MRKESLTHFSRVAQNPSPLLFLPLCVSLSSRYISLFTTAQFIFHCSGISHLNETSSSRVSRPFEGELGGLGALAPWYPSTCHRPSSSQNSSAGPVLPPSLLQRQPRGGGKLTSFPSASLMSGLILSQRRQETFIGDVLQQPHINGRKTNHSCECCI